MGIFTPTLEGATSLNENFAVFASLTVLAVAVAVMVWCVVKIRRR